MKRGITREKLQNEIKKAIYSLDNNNIQEEIIDKIVERGYPRGHIADIMEGNALLEPLSLLDLGVIADTIYKIGDISTIAPDLYFEDAEIERIKIHKIRAEKEDKDLLIFEDARQVMHDIWTVVVPSQKIAELYRENAVGYDFETQRDPKFIKTEDVIIKVANVNWIAVEEIKNLLIQSLFIPNTITFNVPIEDAECIKFDRNKKRLIITDKVLKILDGFHRSLGIIAALREVDLDYNFEMRITCFNTDKARQFIVQEDKRNPINKEYIRSIDETDRVTVVVNNLNQDNKSELKGMITTDKSLITSGKALVGFDTMHDVIERLWKLNTLVDSNKLTEYLKDFFNELVAVYPEEMKVHIKESRRFSYINYESMFVLYLVLAKKLDGNHEWVNQLHNILLKINLPNEKIEEFANTPPSTIKNTINKYIEIAEKIIEGVLENE